MKSFPRSRVKGETVREAVAGILLSEIKDPRVELVTVTSVEVSPDLRHANVFVTAHGGEERYAEVLEGLRSASGRIRTLLGHQVRMRYVPELHFLIDPSVDQATRINEVIEHERTVHPDLAARPDPAGDEARADEGGSRER